MEVGAYFCLAGLGLLFAHAGSVGLSQLHAALAHHHPDALIVAAFVLVLIGFLVKGAMVPFHFWLADAHAVAPAPVCLLFSGVIVPLGIYGVFRIYWAVFAPILPMGDVRWAFIVLGAVTAVLGAVGHERGGVGVTRLGHVVRNLRAVLSRRDRGQVTGQCQDGSASTGDVGSRIDGER